MIFFKYKFSQQINYKNISNIPAQKAVPRHQRWSDLLRLMRMTELSMLEAALLLRLSSIILRSAILNIPMFLLVAVRD